MWSAYCLLQAGSGRGPAPWGCRQMVGQAGRAGEGPAQACRGGQRRLEHLGAWLEQAAAAHEKQASGSCGTGCPPGDGQEGEQCGAPLDPGGPASGLSLLIPYWDFLSQPYKPRKSPPPYLGRLGLPAQLRLSHRTAGRGASKEHRTLGCNEHLPSRSRVTAEGST